MKFPARLLALILPLITFAQDEEFTPLFDGKTLDGWINVNCAPETWSVREGMIHCEGTPTGALRTARHYENFILELEWRHLKAGSNAGIFIWASPLPAIGVPFLRAIEVQVLDHGYGNTENYTTHGDVFAIHGSSMKPFPPSKGMRSFPAEKRSKPSPEWNHYRITCQDGTIRLAVNGKEVSGGSDCVWRKGYIGLESEGGPVDWRNLRIKELPASSATAEQTAPLGDASQTLYDGRTLRGWRAADGWTPEDWKLRAKADASPLANERELADFDLQLDWSWEAPPAALVPPLTFRAGEDREIALPAMPAAKPKGWNRLILSRRGGALSMELNGTPTESITIPESKLNLALRPGGTAVSFANLFAR